MTKKYMVILIIAAAIIIVLAGTAIFVFKDNYNDKNFRIELINPLNKQALTEQGRRLLIKSIKETDYSIETVNASYDEWKPFVENGIRLDVTDFENDRQYIIPSGMKNWKEGVAFRITSAPKEAIQSPVIIDKILFNSFKLSDYLNDDSSFSLNFFAGGSIEGSTFTVDVSDSRVLYQEFLNYGTGDSSRVNNIERALSAKELNDIQKVIKDYNLLTVKSQNFSVEPMQPDSGYYQVSLSLNGQKNEVKCAMTPTLGASQSGFPCTQACSALKDKLNKILGVNIY